MDFITIACLSQGEGLDTCKEMDRKDCPSSKNCYGTWPKRIGIELIHKVMEDCKLRAQSTIQRKQGIDAAIFFINVLKPR